MSKDEFEASLSLLSLTPLRPNPSFPYWVGQEQLPFKNLKSSYHDKDDV